MANGLAFQLAIVLLCMLLGKVLFTSLAKVPLSPLADVMKKIPELLYGIIGAIIVWFVMRKTHTEEYADIKTIKNIGGVALEICVDPDSRSYSWEAFGVALGVATPFTSTFAAVLPPLAMQSQWIIVALGGIVSAVCIIFGELVVRKGA